ncbi:MAG: hypothetical protein ABEI52_12645, partial [Halobacteriaceae archaeon]
MYAPDAAQRFALHSGDETLLFGKKGHLEVTGRMGIGVSGPDVMETPQGTLHVAGTVVADPNASAALPAFSFASDVDTGVFRADPDEIGLATGGQERVRIAADGRMGVNTQTPVERVDVSGSVRVSEQFKGNAADDALRPSHTWAGDEDTGMFLASPDQIALTTGGAEHVRVDAGGYVGVEIAAPAERLHVGGNVLVAGI